MRWNILIDSTLSLPLIEICHSMFSIIFIENNSIVYNPEQITSGRWLKMAVIEGNIYAHTKSFSLLPHCNKVPQWLNTKCSSCSIGLWRGLEQLTSWSIDIWIFSKYSWFERVNLSMMVKVLKWGTKISASMLPACDFSVCSVCGFHWCAVFITIPECSWRCWKS